MFNQRRELPPLPSPQNKTKMKKTSLYIMALLSMVFAACNDDFPTEFVPHTTTPESSFPVNAVSVTPTASSINLIDLLAAETEQPIALGTISLSAPLPENTILKADVEISDEDRKSVV